MKTRNLVFSFLTLALVLVLAQGVSAYYQPYGYSNCGYSGCGGSFDSYSYSSSRASGALGGPSVVRTTDYDRLTAYKPLPYGGYEKVTTYSRVQREIPTCGYGACSGYGYGYGYGANVYPKNFYQYSPYGQGYYPYQPYYYHGSLYY
jgi:hypothetical protein